MNNTYRYEVVIQEETRTEGLKQKISKFEEAVLKTEDVYKQMVGIINTGYFENFMNEAIRDLQESNFELTLPKKLETVLREIRAVVYQLLDLNEDNGEEIISEVRELLMADQNLNDFDSLLIDKIEENIVDSMKDEIIGDFTTFQEALIQTLDETIPQISEQEFPFNDPIAEFNEMTETTEINQLLLERLSNVMTANELQDILERREVESTQEILDEVLTTKFASEMNFYEGLDEDIQELSKLRDLRAETVEQRRKKQSEYGLIEEDMSRGEKGWLTRLENEILDLNEQIKEKMEDVRDKVLSTTQDRLDAMDAGIGDEFKETLVNRLASDLNQGIENFYEKELSYTGSVKVPTPQGVLSQIIRRFSKKTSTATPDKSDKEKEEDRIRMMSNLNDLLARFTEEQGGSLNSQKIAKELAEFLRDTEFEIAAEEIAERIATQRQNVEIGAVMELDKAIKSLEMDELQGLQKSLGIGSEESADEGGTGETEDWYSAIGDLYNMDVDKSATSSARSTVNETMLASVIEQTESQTAQTVDYLKNEFTALDRRLSEIERNIKDTIDNQGSETKGFFQQAANKMKSMPPSPSRMIDMD